MNEHVEVQIGTRRLVVVMEEFLPMEISALAQKVSDRMDEVQSQHSKIGDTSKIAILVALSFAGDYEKERRARERLKQTVDSLSVRLSKILHELLEANTPLQGDGEKE